MKKNIKILFTLLIAFTIMLPFGVRATVDTGYSISTNDPGSGNVGGSSNKVYMVKELKGVRVTLVNNKGNRVQGKKSVEFANAFYSSNKTIYADKTKRSRIEAIVNAPTFTAQGCSVVAINNNQSCKKTMSDYGYFTSDNYGIVSSLNTSNYTYSDVANAFIEIAKDPIKITNFLKTYFNVTYSEHDSVDWYLLVEPLITVSKSKSNCSEGCIIGYVFGTPTELSKYASSNNNKMPMPLNNYYADYHVNYNYLYFTDNTFKGKNSGIESTFTGLTKIDVNKKDSYGNVLDLLNLTTTVIGTSPKGYNVGLIWLGLNAKPKDTCANHSGEFPMVYNNTYYEYNSSVADTILQSSDIVAIKCGINKGPACSKYASKDSKIGDEMIWGEDVGYFYNPDLANKLAGSTIGEIRSNCGKTETYSCSNYDGTATWKGNTIWKDGWFYDSSKGSNTIKSTDSIDTVRSTCGKQSTCKDFYDTSEDFRNVELYSGASKTDCCLNYENLYKDDPGTLTRLYRDHPECYSCTYTEKGINATCSSGSNYSSTGDQFGKGTTTYDEQTCAYYVAAGKINNASSNLVTRRIINSSCKVVCTETVNIQFPLVAQKYYRKGSYIVWPTNIALGETESQLVLNGTAKCWYYVNKVRLNNLYSSDSTTANNEFKNCVGDIISSLASNVIDYDLKGEFYVKYNDSEYGKTISLTRDKIGEVSYSQQGLSSDNAIQLSKLLFNSSASKNNVNSLVSIAETITYTVRQTVNYKIDPVSGYNFVYQDKYYTKNMWGTNAIDIGQSVLGLKDKPYNDGTLEITYNSIGGGSKTYSTTTQTYGTCKYVTTDNIPLVCPEGTDNAGMNLEEIMIKESLSYEEAVNKYCNIDAVTCDAGTYYAGKAILKSCYDNQTCRELTCNIHECTDSGGTCHILNDCMTRQVEDYGKTLEDAKKICTSRVCDGNFGNIEYRVIDLKNPFPGYLATGGSSLFNTTIKGRKPGTNWNSTTIVKKEILNNRGVTGDNVYNLTPLYEFELTPSVIKKIREYNDKHEYDDFTLSCKASNKQACVANGFNFRSKDYGNVSVISNCDNISNLDSFNSCYNNDSLK